MAMIAMTHKPILTSSLKGFVDTRHHSDDDDDDDFGTDNGSQGHASRDMGHRLASIQSSQELHESHGPPISQRLLKMAGHISAD